MNTKNVYVGTIKQCLDCEKYRIDGDITYSEVHRTSGIIEMEQNPVKRNFHNSQYNMGLVNKNAQVIAENVIFIKIRNGEYLPIDVLDNRLMTKIREMIISIKGNTYRTIGTNPSFAGCIFLDINTLKPLFQEDKNEDLSIRNIKKRVLKRQNTK